MKKLLVLAFCALAAGLLQAQAVAFDPADFERHLTFTVAQGKLAAGERFENVPVLLRLGPSIPGFDYADFKTPQYADIVVADSSGNPLGFEIAKWNSRGESGLWVVLPELSAETAINIYYGGAAVERTAPEWTGYLGVWHCEDEGFSDGKIGASSSRPFVFADGSAFNPSEADRFTASGWFKASGAITGSPRLFQRSGVWQVELDAEPVLYAGTSTYGDGNYLRGDEISAVESDWVHLSFVYSGTEILMYVNGDYKRTATVPAAAAAGSAAFAIGSETDGGMVFDGVFDEIRLYDGAAGARRVAVEYAAMADEGFFAGSLEDSRPCLAPAAFAYTARVVLGENVVEGTHFNVPVLLRIPQEMDVSSASLAFADASGRRLAHEVEGVDASGSLRVWVGVPELSSGTAISMYWGGTAEGGADSSAVWNGYCAVLHGESAEARLVEYTSSLAPADAARFTVSGVFKATNLEGSPRLFSRSSISGDGWEIEAGVDGVLYLRGGSFTGQYWSGACAELKDGETVHLAFVYNGDKAKAYVNGEHFADFDVESVVANTAAFGVGRAAGGGYAFNGTHGEARLFGGAMAEAEIALDFEILANASFASFGPVRRIAKTCTDFRKKMKFTVSDAFEGTQESLPVPVRLSTAIAAFDYADLADGFSNVVFADREGNILPFEVEKFDASGESVVWVKPPAVSAGTVFYMYYGGGATNAALQPGAGVWDEYRAVFHMAESSGAAADSAGSLSAEPAGGDLAQMSAVAGVFGQARMNQTSADAGNRLSVPYSAALDFSGVFTASGWFKGNAAVSGWPRLLAHKDSESGWWVECEHGTPGVVNVATVDGGYGVANLPEDIEEWHHWVFVFNGLAVEAYLDGNLVLERAASRAALDPTAPFEIGGEAGQGSFNGAYDEIRLSPVAYSASRAKAEYLSGSSGFVSASSPGPASGGLVIVIK